VLGRTVLGRTVLGRTVLGRTVLGPAVAAPLLACAVLVGCTGSPPPDTSIGLGPLPARICGHAILHSPFSYDKAPGRYRSGTPGLPTYGTARADFPRARAGVVLPTGKHNYAAYQLEPDTVYYLLPGVHTGSIQARPGDAFVGGRHGGSGAVLSGGYAGYPAAIDSNFSSGNQPGVTIEYLTIEKFQPPGNAAAVNQSSNTGWTVRYNTITRNAPGAGVIAGAGSTLTGNCLTLNGQYGFQSSATGPWGQDPLTGGPYGILVQNNEISYNDTCDFEGLLSNPSIGWAGHDPVPLQYRNPHCGIVQPDGDQGGFKLWRTNGVTIKDNYVHNNWGPGMWADTNNANTTYTGNTIMNNDGEAIIEEISYNFSITGNYMSGNGWAAGLSNPQFPTPAIYISQSGSDTTFGGVPGCREAACDGQRGYPRQSVISGNTLVNNGGSVLLWQDSRRFCSAGYDGVCTLTGGGPRGPFTLSGCRANLPSAAISLASYQGKVTGAPAENWWDGCLWRTENVQVTHNVIDFSPARVTACNHTAWPACGAGGIFSNYGLAQPYDGPGKWVIPDQLTFHQHNVWSANTYHGPSTFYAWGQDNTSNPVSWRAWTGSRPGNCGDTGQCAGPFGQDVGSTYQHALATPPSPGAPGTAAG
jgi:hypothetical protein